MKKTQYQQGWEDAINQSESIAEAVKQIKDWNKFDFRKFNLEDITLAVFIGVCLGVVIMMII